MKKTKGPEVEIENKEENPLQLSHPTSNIELTFDEKKECIYVLDTEINDGYEIDLNSIGHEDNIEYFPNPENDGTGILQIVLSTEDGTSSLTYTYPISNEKANELHTKYVDWKNGKNKPDIRNYDVRCLNDDENRKRLAERMKELVNFNFEHEKAIDNARSISSSHRESIKQNNEKLKELADEYDAEYVNRNRECLVVKDFEFGEIKLCHPETGEVFETRAMTNQDRQQQLEFEQGDRVQGSGDSEEGECVETTGEQDIDLPEQWWDFFTDPLKDSAHVVDVRQYYKDGLTDKRMLKIKPAFISDPRYLELLKKLDTTTSDSDLNACAKNFYQIAYGIMIDTGLVK